MSHERRILSLMHWMQMLKQDIEIQRRSKDGEWLLRTRERERDSRLARWDQQWRRLFLSGIENLQGFCKQNQKFSGKVDSNEIFVNRQSVRERRRERERLSWTFFSLIRFDFSNVSTKEVCTKWRKSTIIWRVFPNRTTNIHNVMRKATRIK